MRLLQLHRRATLRPSAFSVIELLIVTAIVGLLVGLALPAVQSARESARRIQCLNNLKQIGLALHHHHDVRGRIPPHAATGDPHDPNVLLQWTAFILPQVEQTALWTASEQACRLETNTSKNPPHVGYATVLQIFVCPSDSRLLSSLSIDGNRAAFTSYMGVSGSPHGGTVIYEGGRALLFPAPGVFGLFGRTPGSRFAEITDGTSQTLMVGERPPPVSLEAGRWYAGSALAGVVFPGPDGAMDIPQSTYFVGDPCMPSGRGFGPGRIDNPCDRFHFWSVHPGGANFVFADGAVRYLPYSAAKVLPALATRNGGEQVELPY
jgi:prepilin-type processing-associated H-X9-DG protein